MLGPEGVRLREVLLYVETFGKNIRQFVPKIKHDHVKFLIKIP